MSRCPSCPTELPPDARFCPACGAAGDRPAVTRTSLIAAPSLTSPAEPFRHGRFVPGTLLDERYRIVGLLGTGGMGEVYRADDLKLGQAVALKFLPQEVEHNEARLQRLLGGVRIARQIAHPNICRVYDVDAVAGRHFISMEYVDGEDLASLLKRIGRLPRDKALQVARQICAGLAAAHEQGILHRDLKPANVMLDGRGRARITDFDLAVAAGQVTGPEAGVGTPGYMAPEQRAGREVTVRSDVYSLGLVLYELFTGEPAFKAASLAELDRLQSQTSLTSPSTLVENLDPAVERAILRCLASDPRERPASALEVAAALPGGDPLAAALAAGETPSPEMVAAAGSAGALQPGVAWTGLALALGGLLLAAALGSSRQLAHLVGLPKSPEVLADHAAEIAARLGHADPPRHAAYWLAADREFLNYIEDADRSSRRWDRLTERSPAAIRFTYRSSPRHLVPLALAWGAVDLQDPPRTVSGMITLQTDPEGRLTFFEAIPPERDAAAGPWPDPDWRPLFDAAGVDAARLTPVATRYNPLVDCDARAAWEGPSRDDPAVTVRYEAGAYHGRPVYFETRYPWDRPARMEPYRPGGLERAAEILVAGVLVLLFGGGALLARRNLRLGRGDRRGALRLALLMFVASMTGWLFGTRHVAAFGQEFRLALNGIAAGLLNGGLLWMVYIALEPFVRRAWPDALISWSRVMAGHLRDPRVGRDILAGCVGGALLPLLGHASLSLDALLGFAPRLPHVVLPVTGVRQLGQLLADLVSDGPTQPFFLLLFLVLFRVVLRRAWLAAGAVFVLFSFLTVQQARTLQPSSLMGAVVIAVFLLVLFRLGVFAVMVLACVLMISQHTPGAFDLASWYAPYAVTLLVLLGALAAYGFHAALAGRPLFGARDLDADAGT